MLERVTAQSEASQGYIMKGEIRMYIIEAIIIFFVLIIGIAVGIIIESKSLKSWFNKRLDDIYSQKDIKPLTIYSNVQIDRSNIDEILSDAEKTKKFYEFLDKEHCNNLSKQLLEEINKNKEYFLFTESEDVNTHCKIYQMEIQLLSYMR